MKYIRTKNGVYCFEKEYILKQNKKGQVIIRTSKGYDIFYLKDILNQANTIPELVDEYILKDTETGYCGVVSKETMKHSINPGTAYGREFYAAIWSIDEKGIPTLKPVAKINNKGELELL